jgi:hypothetical protein
VTPLAQAHGYKIGDLVQTWYADTGSATPGYVYGIVTFAGPKRVGVAWESGRKSSLHKERWHVIERVPERMRDVALDATKLPRAVLLAKITAAVRGSDLVKRYRTTVKP